MTHRDDTLPQSDSHLHLSLRSPEGLVFTGPVWSVRLPGVDGDFGLLPRHAPLVAVTRCGVMNVIHRGGASERMAVGEGFVIVARESIKLVVHFLDSARNIDLDRAHRAVGRALARLRAEAEDEGWDLERAEASLCRALARTSACGCGCHACTPALARRSRVSH